MQSLTVPQAPRSHPYRARCAASLARKSMLLLAVAGAAVTAAAQSVAPAPEKTSLIFLRAARLIDGRGGEPLAPAMVRVDGDKITAVGSSLPIPEGARQIDIRGSTLVPGFIDLHTHLTGRRRSYVE